MECFFFCWWTSTFWRQNYHNPYWLYERIWVEAHLILVWPRYGTGVTGNQWLWPHPIQTTHTVFKIGNGSENPANFKNHSTTQYFFIKTWTNTWGFQWEETVLDWFWWVLSLQWNFFKGIIYCSKNQPALNQVCQQWKWWCKSWKSQHTCLRLLPAANIPVYICKRIGNFLSFIASTMHHIK